MSTWSCCCRQRRLYRVRAFVTIEIGAKNEVLDPVYPLPSLPSRSKTLFYRKLPIEELGGTDHLAYLLAPSSPATCHLTRKSTCASRKLLLSWRLWENNQLALNTKLKVFHAHVLSTLFYASESWT